MADVFISYARQDREVARRLATSFEAHGWSVWWDHSIRVGKTFDEEIERELYAAKCIVVLWSAHSVSSEWVKNEAAVASERGVLIPAFIEQTNPPLEFRRRQTADLVDWDGDHGHEGYRAVCESVGATISQTPAMSGERYPTHGPTRPDQTKSWRALIWGVLAFSIMAAWFWGYQSSERVQKAPASVLPESLENDSDKPVGGAAHGASASTLPMLDKSKAATQDRPAVQARSAKKETRKIDLSGKWIIPETSKNYETVLEFRMFDGLLVGDTQVEYPQMLVTFNWVKRRSSIYDIEAIADRLNFKTKRTMLTEAGAPATMVNLIDHYVGRVDGDRIYFRVSREGGESWEAIAVKSTVN